MLDADRFRDWMEAHRLKGGSEHKLGLDNATGRVFKSAGVQHIGSDTIYAHLTDYLLANHFFGDDVRLEGFYEGTEASTKPGDNLHTVISHPWIVGDHPSRSALKKWPEEWGWRYPAMDTNPEFTDPVAGELSLWDVRPDNAIMDAEGRIAPVDFHFYFHDDAERHAALQALGLDAAKPSE